MCTLAALPHPHPHPLFPPPPPQGHQRPKRLKHLAEQFLGLAIQGGEHDPAEDARAALALYRHFRREWEGGLVRGRPVGAAGPGGAVPPGGEKGPQSRRASTGSALTRRPAAAAAAGAAPGAPAHRGSGK